MSDNAPSHLVIAYIDRLLDSATTVTGFSWDGLNPVANLTTNKFSQTANAIANNSAVAVDFGSSKSIEVLALPRHTLSTNGTWRVRVSTDVTLLTDPASVDLGDIVYDSGVVNVWPSLDSYTTVPYEEYSIWAAELVNVHNPPGVLWLPRGTEAQYMYVDFSDPDADDYTIGKLFAGPYWQPENGVSRGWSTQYISPTKPKRLEGGLVTTEPSNRYRRIEYDCKFIPEDDVFTEAAIIDREYALNVPFVSIIDPSDSKNAHRVFIYGTNSKIHASINTSYGYYSKKFTIDEWL